MGRDTYSESYTSRIRRQNSHIALGLRERVGQGL